MASTRKSYGDIVVDYIDYDGSYARFHINKTALRYVHKRMHV